MLMSLLSEIEPIIFVDRSMDDNFSSIVSISEIATCITKPNSSEKKYSFKLLLFNSLSVIFRPTFFVKAISSRLVIRPPSDTS